MSRLLFIHFRDRFDQIFLKCWENVIWPILQTWTIDFIFFFVILLVAVVSILLLHQKLIIQRNIHYMHFWRLSNGRITYFIIFINSIFIQSYLSLILFGLLYSFIVLTLTEISIVIDNWLEILCLITFFIMRIKEKKFFINFIGTTLFIIIFFRNGCILIIYEHRKLNVFIFIVLVMWYLLGNWM